MPRRTRTNSRKRVALSIPMDATFGRQMVLGVIGFVRRHPEWQIEVCNALPYLTEEQLVDWDGDGMIVQVYREEIRSALARKRIPMVNTATARFARPMTSVTVDNDLVGEMAAAHLLEQGLQHFAFAGVDGLYLTDLRLAAFRRALQRHGHEVTPCLFGRDAPITPALQVDPAFHLAALRGLPRPVGVFACNDRIGFGVLEACLQLGLACPEQVAVVGVDNDDVLCALAAVPMTSIETDVFNVGYHAATALDRLMAGDRTVPASIRIPPKSLVCRQSSDLHSVDDDVVASALRYIRGHVGDGIGAAEVAQTVPISRRSLERRFHTVLGHSILDEIQRVRVARAQELLAQTDLSVTEVARQSGFGGLQRFGTLFRRHTGMSARAYRSQVAGDVVVREFPA